jgi:hypothetical protein
LASPAIWRSRRAIGVARASSSPQQSWMIPRGVAGSSRSASHARPGPVHRLEWSQMPRSASAAAPGSCRRSTAAPGRPGDAARPASTLSFLQPGRGDGLAAAGMDQVRFQLQLLQQLDQPAPAVSGLERHRGPGREGAQDRHQLGRIIGNVAVALLGAGGIHDGDLGALAMHVHADVHTHVGLLPRARWSRSLGCRAEQGTGARPT